MKIPRTIEDIERLIELGIPESIHLDYKASPALSKKKKGEICKDISAFANSDGGMLIYGVKEEHTVPTEMDSGVDTSQINKEWIDEILATNISPIISGIEIIEIKKTANKSIFVVYIPKSFRGPHQCPDKRYYKRYNARSAPMENYEINDVRNRRKIVPSFISVDIQLENPWVKLIVENTGNESARDVRFIFPENFSWHKERGKGELPNALKNDDSFQYINLEECYSDVIKEVLGVDQIMANKIYFHYQNNRKSSSLEEIPGMTEELLEKIKKHTKAS